MGGGNGGARRSAMMGQRRGRLVSVPGLGQRRSQPRITMSTRRATMITWLLDPSTGLIVNYLMQHTNPIAVLRKSMLLNSCLIILLCC